MTQVKKVWSVICKILNAFFLVLLVGLVIILLYLAIGSRGNGLPFLQNYQLFTVLSGSMEPKLNVGGVIIVEKVDPMTLQEGDIITFLSNDTNLNGKVVSHRIVEIVNNSNGRMFITKGDANESRDDAAAVPDNVIGRVIFHIPYLGYLLNFMKTKNGFFLILLLPCMVILLVESISLMKNFWAYMDEKKALKEGKGESETPPEGEALPAEAEEGSSGQAEDSVKVEAPEPSEGLQEETADSAERTPEISSPEDVQMKEPKLESPEEKVEAPEKPDDYSENERKL